jgi:hypothetical protein
MNNIMKQTLILTGCDNAMAEVADITEPSHKAYANRHGYAFQRMTQADYQPGSHPSWQKLRFLNELLPDYDQILWLDADTIITNPEISIDTITADRPGSLFVSTDWTYPMPEDAIKHFSLGNFIAKSTPEMYGVIAAALKRTEWANRGLWEQQAIQEEYRANPDIRPHIRILPRRALNAVPATDATTGPEPWQPGDFLCHATFLPFEERIAILQEKAVEAFQAIVPLIPEWHETVMCMDKRHIACLYEILRLTKPKNCLEIGVWQGAATAAFMQALDRKEIANYAACDVGIQDRFREVVGSRDVTIRNTTSEQVLTSNLGLIFDLIFCDGDHGLETCQMETKEVLRLQPRIVLSHDTNAYDCGWHCCPGPKFMKETLQANGWLVIEDHKDRRPTEQTRRGFMAATKDQTTFQLLQNAFARIQ